MKPDRHFTLGRVGAPVSVVGAALAAAGAELDAPRCTGTGAPPPYPPYWGRGRVSREASDLPLGRAHTSTSLAAQGLPHLARDLDVLARGDDQGSHRGAARAHVRVQTGCAVPFRIDRDAE